MKIVILDGYTLNPGDLSFDALKQFGELTVYDDTWSHEVNEKIADSDIVFTNKVVINKQTIDTCKQMKYIGVFATGYDVVDVKYAYENGITVTNIPAYGTYAVAQHAISLLLEATNHVGYHAQTVRDLRWVKETRYCYWDKPLMELFGKTLGIIGLGRIGLRVAEIAQSLGMNVLAYSSGSRNAKESDTLQYASLQDIFERSDVISLHCPLNDASRHIIRKETISAMKDGVMIVNTSRGALIEQNDLTHALVTGKVAYACLDVVDGEPMKADNPLLTAPNCIITPHVAWAPIETRRRLLGIAVQNLQHFLEGNAVNIVR